MAVRAPGLHVGLTPQGSPAASTAALMRKDLLANGLVVLILIGAMKIWSMNAPAYIMPAPEHSAAAILAILQQDYGHILATVGRVCIAILFSMVVGSLIGVAMAMVRPLQPFLRSVVIIDTGIPALSWMLFAIFWFKSSETRVFFILAMILIPFYALNVYDGIRALSVEFVEMVETFRPTRLQVLHILIIPQIVPYILMTTKSIIGYATRMTVFAELLASNVGMGAQMSLAQNNLQMDGVIAWTVVLVVLNVLIQGAVAWVERRALKWRPEVSVR